MICPVELAHVRGRSWRNGGDQKPQNVQFTRPEKQTVNEHAHMKNGGAEAPP
jgi:hypothetical protein